jgi:chaperonin GroES
VIICAKNSFSEVSKKIVDKIFFSLIISTLDTKVLIQPLPARAGCLKEEVEGMEIKPLGDRVVVKPLEAEAKTKGGILLPDTAKEKPQEGKVVAVGKGKMLDSGNLQAPEVKVGDRVLYGKYSGNEITTKEGEELLIMREEDILAIIK